MSAENNAENAEDAVSGDELNWDELDPGPEDDPRDKEAGSAGVHGARASGGARKAGGKPRKVWRPDRETKEAIFEWATFLLSRHLCRSDCRKALRRKFNYQFSMRACDRYLRAAGARLCELTGKSRDECMAESVAFWESIISGLDTSIKDKCFARVQLDKLLGLSAETVVLKGSKDEPLQVHVTETVVTSRREARELLDLYKQHGLATVIEGVNLADDADAHAHSEILAAAHECSHDEGTPAGHNAVPTAADSVNGSSQASPRLPASASPAVTHGAAQPPPPGRTKQHCPPPTAFCQPRWANRVRPPGMQ